MLGINCSCICHSFLASWSFYFSRCNDKCWDWHFFVPNGTTRYMSHVTPSCVLLSPTLWEPSGSILSPFDKFFGKLLTWSRVYFTSNKHSFRYHVSMSLLMCGFKGRRLVINLSYHTHISFIFIPLPYNIMHLSWLATFYNCPFFVVLVWSYYWWSRYPFISMPMWEWTYYMPQYTSGYCCNY
jgi:hypothetical protein